MAPAGDRWAVGRGRVTPVRLPERAEFAASAPFPGRRLRLSPGWYTVHSLPRTRTLLWRRQERGVAGSGPCRVEGGKPARPPTEPCEYGRLRFRASGPDLRLCFSTVRFHASLAELYRALPDEHRSRATSRRDRSSRPSSRTTAASSTSNRYRKATGLSRTTTGTLFTIRWTRFRGRAGGPALKSSTSATGIIPAISTCWHSARGHRAFETILILSTMVVVAATKKLQDYRVSVRFTHIIGLRSKSTSSRNGCKLA